MTFVHNIQMFDCVLVINEVVEFEKRHGREGLIFKIDFEKAYNRVSWNYLISVIRMMGFGARLSGWMKECVFSSSFSVLANGSPTKDFEAHIGLRQRDPLSHFIFLLAA